MTSTCRSCGGNALRSFLDLGNMPLSDGLRQPAELSAEERRYPLEVAFCSDCTLVQILEEVDPEEMFCRDYPYFSSFAGTLLAHSEANVKKLIAERSLDEQSLVIELASNDGYLLQYFIERGIPVLGIDPAAGPVKAALDKGVPTMQAFFGRELADQLYADGKRADVVVGNNVLAHVPDLNGFVAGIARLLKPDGTTSIEAPYVHDLIEGCQFDTIYHEHLCYYSVTSAKALFERHGLHLNKVEHLDIHGGSLRYFASPTKQTHPSVAEFLAQEERLGVSRFDYYANFGDSVRRLRDGLRALVAKLKAGGKSVAAYGAAAKGAIMLNYCGLDEASIDFVADRNVHKQGRYMPGVDLQIVDPKEISEQQPDYLLILPWNLRDEIIAQQAEFAARGGQFVIPCPSPQVVT